jgi:hypothetical protein
MIQDIPNKLHITVQDASNYFKGLLILIGRDKEISEQERELMMHVGKALGFEKEFCKTAIQEVLENTYLVDCMPEFSLQKIAEMFVLDGLAIAASDGLVHELEEKWLRSIAEKYALPESWFVNQKNLVVSRLTSPDLLQVDLLMVDYSKKE